MGLHIRVSCSKQLLRALNRELLRDIDVFTATVVALARITLGVLIGENGALRLQNPWTGVVFRGDKLNVLFLPLVFGFHRRPELLVKLLDSLCLWVKIVGRQVRSLIHNGCPNNWR